MVSHVAREIYTDETWLDRRSILVAWLIHTNQLFQLLEAPAEQKTTPYFVFLTFSWQSSTQPFIRGSREWKLSKILFCSRNYSPPCFSFVIFSTVIHRPLILLNWRLVINCTILFLIFNNVLFTNNKIRIFVQNCLISSYSFVCLAHPSNLLKHELNTPFVSQLHIKIEF